MELKGKCRKMARICASTPLAMAAASPSADPLRSSTATSSMIVSRTLPSGGRSSPYDVSCARARAGLGGRTHPCPSDFAGLGMCHTVPNQINSYFHIPAFNHHVSQATI